MKKNNLRLLSILLTGLLLVPVCLVASQLPSGKTERVFEKWEWRDATLQSVASQISVVSGVDIVVDSRIAAEKINISLRNRTWQEVINIICNTKNLTYQVLNEGSYIYIANARDLNNRLIEEAQSARNLEAIEEVEKFTIKLKNTTAEEMREPILGVLSQRGKVYPVKHTNSLIIHELPKNIAKVKEFIDEMDTEMLQISISAKIVEIASGFENGMGIQWSFFDGKGGEITHLPAIPESDGGILSNALGKATYGVLDPNGFSIALEYLFTNTNSEILAEPQVTTLENKEAVIFMGSTIPINILDYAGNTVTRELEVRTELKVTPTVTGQGQIKMDLSPTKRSYEMTEDGPIVHEQGATTNVVVQDGETIVIAGLTNDDAQETESGIPFLKDIPILGHLFKRSTKSNTKRDLVIFVTPHIIKTTKLELLTEENQAKIADSIKVSTDIVEISVEPQEISIEEQE